jgi:hypothetical protein
VGTNGQTITISAPAPGVGGAPTLDFWQNLHGGTAVSNYATIGSAQNSMSVFQWANGQVMPGNMTANTMMFAVAMSNATVTASSAKTFIIDIGIYTANGASLSMLNSVRTSLTHAAAANNSQSYFGTRYWTIHSSQWSTQPTFAAGSCYYGVIRFQSIGQPIQTFQLFGQNLWATFNRSGTVGSVSVSNTSMGWCPFSGVVSFSSSSLPTTIDRNQINKQSAGAYFVPALTMQNYSGSW